MRRDLVDIPGRDADPGSLVNLAVYLDAETTQEGAADGLVVSVGLRNEGEQDVPLLNPFELIQFQVRNEQGFPLRLPTKPPSLLTQAAGGASWTLDSPLPILDVRRNDQSAEPSILDVETFPMGPHDDVRVSFAIDRFVEDGGSEVKISDGLYRVRCIATLIHADQRQMSRILQSDEIEIRFAKRS